MIEGHLSSNGVVVEVWATERKPRLAGDGCGCERDVRYVLQGFMPTQNVVKLCEKHGREPGIVEYMLQ